jgi:N6-adenosine-specific RNA methylase IME4
VNDGFFFLQSSSLCLVGLKSCETQSLNYKRQVAGNIIYEEVKGNNAKPDCIYSLINLMVPGAKKLELFAEQVNQRSGWFSLRHQLGQSLQGFE